MESQKAGFSLFSFFIFLFFILFVFSDHKQYLCVNDDKIHRKKTLVCKDTHVHVNRALVVVFVCNFVNASVLTILFSPLHPELHVLYSLCLIPFFSSVYSHPWLLPISFHWIFHDPACSSAFRSFSVLVTAAEHVAGRACQTFGPESWMLHWTYSLCTNCF